MAAPLYPYQQRVKALIQGGKSVLLQAPTGAGKTRAALAPFIEAFFDLPPEAFPRKCVYSVPMRVLANQFVLEYQGLAASYRDRFRRELRVEIQTGEQPGDRQLERDLVFCTIDQFLSSYLMMPYGLPQRLANLNAGALAGAYLVFDEFHLLDPKSTLPTALYAAKQASRLAPVLLMTATFSRTMLDALAREVGAEVVGVSAEEARDIETRGGQAGARERRWRAAGEALAAEAVLAAHGRRSLALCNTVQRAQTLYRELRALVAARGLDTRLLLLHSRFLPEDRRRIEGELRRLFGPQAEAGGSAIAVATQTIEVGVDITCETLHTELAPASSLIQRAGRCARYPGERGEVVVYPVEKPSPYQGAHKEEMPIALEWLQARDPEQALDFGLEQAFVDAVATARDRRILMDLSGGRVTHAEAVQRAQAGDRQEGDGRLLVRDADSRLVLIHSDPDALLGAPYSATGFSLQPGALYGMFDDWQERGRDLEWRVKTLIEDKGGRADKSEENRTEYDWRPLENKELLSGARVLVVNPELAGYTPEEGFVADRGDTGFESSAPPGGGGRDWEGYSYRLESYEEHIRRVLQAFEELALPELRYPAQALERAAGWPAGSVARAARLVCLLHDVGKLSRGWQRWVQVYQKAIGAPVPSGFSAAHTDSEPGNPAHRAAAQAAGGRPRHAGEGALAASRALVRALNCEPLARAALTAITRHHSPFAGECGAYALAPGARAHIEATLGLAAGGAAEGVDLSLLQTEASSPPLSFANAFVRPNQDYEWLAYVLLVRALRRADQAGTAAGSQ